MFKIGAVLVLHVRDNGSVTTSYGNTVIDYEDGLLKVRDLNGKETIYNVHSASFVKAERQE